MKRVAIYCRLSDEDKDKKNVLEESESIQNQKSMLMSYCNERGWCILKVYCDEDYSGADRNRPEFNEMIEACRNGLVDIVLCKAQSRFSRDMEIVERYIHGLFLEWGVRFIGVVDHADTAIEGNKKARQINGLINEWYLEDLSDNIRRTLRHKKQKGEFTGSFAPYGYKQHPNNKNQLIVDPEPAGVVKDIFNMYLNGHGYIKIAKELNARGISSPSAYKKKQGSNYKNSHQQKSTRGGLWTDSTIYSIVRKEVYAGTLVQGRTENISYKNQKRRNLPESEWIKVPNAHEAIITYTEWNKCVDLRQHKGRSDKFTGTNYSLSRKVYCAECLSTMWKMSYALAGGRYNYLRCRMVKAAEDKCCNTHSIRLDVLEGLVLNEINRLLDEFYNPQYITINEQKEDTERKAALESNLQELEMQIHTKQQNAMTLYDDKLKEIISEEQFVIFNKKILAEITDLEKRARYIKKQLKSAGLYNIEQSKEEMLSKHRNLNEFNKQIADEFIKSVHIGALKEDGVREIVIDWKF